MKYFLFIVTIITLVHLFSCSSKTLNVDLHMPTHALVSPETTGKLMGIEFKVNSHVAHKLSLARSHQSTSLFSSTPSAIVVDTNPWITSSSGVGHDVNLGVYKRIDLIYKKANEQPHELGAKFQFLGDVKRKKGVKMSLFGTVGYQKDEEVANESGLTSKEIDYKNTSAITRAKTVTVGLVTGYRFEKYFLAYISGVYQSYHIESTLTIVNTSSYVLDRKSENLKALIGIYVNLGTEHLFLQSEGGYSKVRLKGAGIDKHEMKSFALSVGGKF